MPKIRKKTSKRVGFREKYRVQKKVLEHHRKLRKTAKKLSSAGMKPKPAKKTMVIPNSFPGKETLLNEMEKQDIAEREARKNAKTLEEADKMADANQDYAMEQDIRAAVEKKDEAENNGLTAEELKEAELLMDPESALKNVNKKTNWRETKKSIDQSDVLLMVLDARDPEGTRCPEIEKFIVENGKKIIYVINKTDLVPEENAEKWQKHFKAQKKLCVGMVSAKVNKDGDEM